MKKSFYLCFIIAAVVLAVVGWMILPDMVVVQFGMNGTPSNTMPKLGALAAGVAITVVGCLFGMKKEEQSYAEIILSIVGIFILGFTILVNR